MKVLQKFEKWMRGMKKRVKSPTVAHKDDLLNGLPPCPIHSAKQQHMSGTPSKRTVESTCTSTSSSLLELNQDVDKLDSTSLTELDVSDFVSNGELIDVPCKPVISMESPVYLNLQDTSFSSFMESLELSLVDYSGEYDSRTSNSSFVNSSLIDCNAFIDVSKPKAIHDCLSNPINEQTLRTIPPQPIAYMKLPGKCLRLIYPKNNLTVLQGYVSASDHANILFSNDKRQKEHVESQSYMNLECSPVLTFVPPPVGNYTESSCSEQNMVVKIDSEVSKRKYIEESHMTLMKGPILYYFPVSSQKLSRIPHTEQCLPSFELNDDLGRVHKVKLTELCERKAHKSTNVNLRKRDSYLVTSGKRENTLKRYLLEFEKISPEENGQTESIARQKDLFSLSSDFMGILTANPTLKMFSSKSRQLIRSILFYSCHALSVQDAFCIYPLHKTPIRQNDSGFASEDPMRFEWQRLRSFHSYPISASGVSILHLAQEGFYFTGNGHDTKCFLCHCVYSGWSSDSDVRRTHLQLSPNCPIACEQESSNIPINPSRRRGHVQQQEIGRFDENVAEDSGELPTVASHVEESSDHSSNTSFISRHERHLSQSSARNHGVNFISESFPIQASGGNSPVNRRRIDTPYNGSGVAVNRRRINVSRNDSEEVSTTRVPAVNEETPQRTTPTDFRNSRSERSSRDVPANRGMQNSSTSSEQSVLTYKQKLSSHLDPLGIVWEKPKFSAYVILTTRVSSYEGWPENMTQTPIEMSKAGFFYAGHGDYVRCFFCGGGLRNWERDDVPWEEHARWFPRCAFVRNVQGQEYVDIIQRKNQPDHSDPVCETTGLDLEKQRKIDLLKEEGYPQQRIQFAINVWEQRRDLAGYKLPLKAEDLVEIIEEDGENHQNESTSASPSPTELETLKTEFSSLQSTLLCKVCFTQEVGMAFLPCGHLICCKECGPAVRKCLLCDVIIKGTVKTYFS